MCVFPERSDGLSFPMVTYHRPAISLTRHETHVWQTVMTAWYESREESGLLFVYG